MHAPPDPAVSVPPVLLHSCLEEWGMKDYRKQMANVNSISYFLTKFYIDFFYCRSKEKRQGVSQRKKTLLVTRKEAEAARIIP